MGLRGVTVAPSKQEQRCAWATSDRTAYSSLITMACSGTTARLPDPPFEGRSARRRRRRRMVVDVQFEQFRRSGLAQRMSGAQVWVDPDPHP
jgi:hypothetical protein